MPELTVPSIDPRQPISFSDYHVDEDARRFLARLPVSYPVGADPTTRAATTFGVTPFPAFLIDRQGVVQHVYRGAADVRAIGEHMRRLAHGEESSDS